ncbi:MAG: hypothetical protein LUF02_02125 [Erysipelotrichaceae bacterium]|nr:hypothetical protein [Erysipelotrichaceae bacterium]
MFIIGIALIVLGLFTFFTKKMLMGSRKKESIKDPDICAQLQGALYFVFGFTLVFAYIYQLSNIITAIFLLVELIVYIIATIKTGSI